MAQPVAHPQAPPIVTRTAAKLSMEPAPSNDGCSDAPRDQIEELILEAHAQGVINAGLIKNSTHFRSVDEALDMLKAMIPKFPECKEKAIELDEIKTECLHVLPEIKRVVYLQQVLLDRCTELIELRQVPRDNRKLDHATQEADLMGDIEKLHRRTVQVQELPYTHLQRVNSKMVDLMKWLNTTWMQHIPSASVQDEPVDGNSGSRLWRMFRKMCKNLWRFALGLLGLVGTVATATIQQYEDEMKAIYQHLSPFSNSLSHICSWSGIMVEELDRAKLPADLSDVKSLQPCLDELVRHLQEFARPPPAMAVPA